MGREVALGTNGVTLGGSSDEKFTWSRRRRCRFNARPSSARSRSISTCSACSRRCRRASPTSCAAPRASRPLRRRVRP
eukprot:6202175-Pleurochrysis_carterae.AAC.2